jgi:predicted O-methyltransferase YrrM
MSDERADVVERLIAERPIFHTKDTTGSWLAQPNLLRAIAAKVSAGDRTLEVGCGASTVVFVAMGARHTSISVDAAEHGRVRDYCDRLGLDHSSLDLIEGVSDRVLPTLDAADLDVALIDGDHAFPYPAVDWHYVNRMLRVGGVLVMDDVHARPTGLVCESMLMSPRWELMEVIDGQAAAFRKLADGYADWQEDPFSSSSDLWFMGRWAAQRERAVRRAWGAKESVEARFPAFRRFHRRLRGRPTQ